ncbi:chromosome segregation protein SMC [Halorhodospira abdelmalekii]|uniref:chromosome segregation protein SMC n=1 Tax=Halorhodospira abdelmalekii TaxID=421629 RepID=UPI00190523F5|nr:chromosome segregation protein SMC [Halorhodospira abdelmalekii]MBK1733918.1 chromosome segregation protein SMC [Halorhodospira abdelmalekii]
MQLKRIKLAGFKSFVDPTAIPLPGRMNGVVGPNGCGKSNVIDAVRWVMGESSAKHLRGGSMSDVIFSGSGARAPVGQASVELLFDNSAGALGGRYAAYSEIAIKRQVNREGQSHYSLNGTRCRRRDISDLFLGTGVRPRGYTIIEQGMISRVIESRPEELRLYLEEAAGISIYKERRRETERRIRDTRENLERLDDLRDEVYRQLEKVRKQAKVAEQYRRYRASERHRRGELALLRVRDLDFRIAALEHTVRTHDNARQAALSEQRHAESESVARRERLQAHNERLQSVQEHFYAAGNELSALEERIHSAGELRQRRQQELAEARQALAELEQTRSSDQQRHVELTEQQAALAPECAAAEQDEQAAERQQQEARAALDAWRDRAERTRSEQQAAAQRAELEQTRQDAAERRSGELDERLRQLAEELESLDETTVAEELERQKEALEAAEVTLETQREQREDAAAELTAALAARDHAAGELEQAREGLSALRARLTSLETLQEAALGRDRSERSRWLEQQGWEECPRLAECLEVTPRWSRALAAVLGEALQGLCLDDVERPERLEAPEWLQAWPQELVPGTTLTLFTRLSAEQPSEPLRESSIDLPPQCLSPHSPHPHSPDSPDSPSKPSSESGVTAERLAAHVHITTGYAPGLAEWLAGIYCVESLSAARALRPHLRSGESVVTADGVWFGRDWLRLPGSDEAADGLLEREREIAELRGQFTAAEGQVEEAAERVESAREAVIAAEQARDAISAELTLSERRQADLEARLEHQRERLEQLQARRHALLSEQQRLAQQRSAAAAECEAAARAAQEAAAAAATCAERDAALEQERESLRAQLEASAEALRVARERRYTLSLEQQQAETALRAVADQLERSAAQCARYRERCQALEEALAVADEPIETLQRQREQLLVQRGEYERELQRVRQASAELEQQLQAQEQLRFEAEQRAEQAREASAAVQLELGELRAHRSHQQQALDELGEETASVAARLDGDPAERPPEARQLPTCAPAVDQAAAGSESGLGTTIAAWTRALEGLSAQIERLGSVNLAAIDECAQLEERCGYLDQQHADLSEALETLEGAIRRIDRATRARFRETYERVNEELGRLFPRLFGGGRAYLELTDDDLLASGVAVLAQPPGKRIANIHMLSGGEKALTAVALVFAIFNLNPAPFCMLDEVDAPLDEANVGRFCDLVAEMSERVQFILITHNRTTMERVSHLLGVTMNEPGVSRLVAVDVDEAVDLAQAG